jgi:hypothetical protein
LCGASLFQRRALHSDENNCRLLTPLVAVIVDRLPKTGMVMWLRGGSP